MDIDVSIIIVNYNTRQMTSECIDSVFEKTTGISFEVIVVDNASKDNSREFFSADKRIIYIYNDENIGFGRANNKGIEIACGRNILFLNSDTLLINNAIKMLSEYLDAHDDVGVCGGNLFNLKCNPSLSYRRLLPGVLYDINELFCRIPEKVIYGENSYFNHTNHVLYVKYISGADLMLRKSIVNDIGGFSDDFFMYYEETDLCCRIIKNGWKIASIPYAEIQHLEGHSFAKESVVNRVKVRFVEQSRLTYLIRNHNKMERVCSNSIYFIFLLSRVLFITSCSKRQQYKERLRVFLKSI